ncbi:unnamed protein product [Leptosia nina]|uniref:Uncharacterized protein n=1 Tax=Leptosia nina TaxID=320188 RepID=A0AAV1JS62_9NEOP
MSSMRWASIGRLLHVWEDMSRAKDILPENNSNNQINQTLSAGSGMLQSGNEAIGVKSSIPLHPNRTNLCLF